MVDTPPGHARNLAFDSGGYWVAVHGEPPSYPEHGNELCFSLEENSFWFRHRNNVIVSVVQRFPPSGSLFDIGGGNGYVAAGLERAGFPTVVVEPGRAGAENACRRGLRNVICATFDAAGFMPGTIDAVCLFDVLEHMRDDSAFLASLRQHLRPGGRIYLTVPAFQFLWSREDDDAGHFRRYTRRSLAEVLRSAGFQVEYTTYFFWFLPLPVWLLRVIPSRLGWRSNPSLESTKREHTVGGGLTGRLVEWALSRELAWLTRGRTIPFGGSCLAVARSLPSAAELKVGPPAAAA
jgi:SAM-dependent methyltransferase